MKKLLIIPVLLFGLYSCGNHGVSPEEIKAAENAIQTRFNAKKVNITILSDKRLQVAVTNYAFTDSSDAGKQALADSIGIVSKEYLEKESLIKGSVVFVNTGGYITDPKDRTQNYKMHL